MGIFRIYVLFDLRRSWSLQSGFKLLRFDFHHSQKCFYVWKQYLNILCIFAVIVSNSVYLLVLLWFWHHHRLCYSHPLCRQHHEVCSANKKPLFSILTNERPWFRDETTHLCGYNPGYHVYLDMGAPGSSPSSTVCVVCSQMINSCQSLFPNWCLLGRDHNQAGHDQLGLLQAEVEHTRIADRVRQKLSRSSGVV